MTELRVEGRILRDETSRQLPLEEAMALVPVDLAVDTNQTERIVGRTGGERVDGDRVADVGVLADPELGLERRAQRSLALDPNRVRAELFWRLEVEDVD